MRKAMLLLAVFGLVGMLWAADPFVGTWKLNVAKSRFDPPSSALKSDLVKIAAQINGLKYTFDRVDLEGKAIHIEYAAKFDGKDYPVTITGDRSVNTTSLRRIDANTIKSVNKINGKETERNRVVIAKDGKSSTVTTKVKNEKGQEFTTITIYEKQ
jgi:hypothetical protein